MSLSTVALIGTGAIINTVNDVSKKVDPFPMLFASGLFMWMDVGLDAVAPRLGMAFAAAYLVWCFLNNGQGILDFFTKSATQKSTPPNTPQQGQGKVTPQ